jgi:hypothetical protein
LHIDLQINMILLFTSAVDVAYLAAQTQVIGWTYAPNVNNMGFAFSAINIVVKVCSSFSCLPQFARVPWLLSVFGSLLPSPPPPHTHTPTTLGAVLSHPIQRHHAAKLE